MTKCYEGKIRQHTISIAVVRFLSVLIGGVVVFVITHNVRKRFRPESVETAISIVQSRS